MKHFITLLTIAAIAAAVSANTLLNKLNDDFTYKMTKEMGKQHPGKSYVQSALSVLFPLGLLGLGSVGRSHDEILTAIGLPNAEAIASAFPILNNGLKSIKGVELKTGNRIYLSQNYELVNNFATLSRTLFDSEVKKVDFSDSVASADNINEWVENQTNHRIKDLVSSDSFDSYTTAVLVNAIYFKGQWQEEFDKELTREADFHVTRNNTIRLPFMHKTSDFKYYDSVELNAQFLEIPYKGNEASFLICLPNEIEGSVRLEENLTPEMLNSVVKKMKEVEVKIKIPKFKIETKTNLKTSLEGIGIHSIFNPSTARLDIMVKDAKNLYVSNAKQKALIEVSEEGVEAAAANDFGISYLSAYVPEFERYFVADHPFIFYLKQGQMILFNGLFHH